jgi:glycosyltransferase involved in cell wall biosynthesis
LIVPHFSGIGHYTLELLYALDRLVDNRPDIQITLGVYFRKIKKIKGYKFRNFKYKRTPFSLRTNNALKIRGIQPFYDLLFGKHIYFFPNYTSWPLLFSKSASVIYDLSFEHFPQYVEPRNQKFLSDNVRKSVERSSAIVTISTNSQTEITDFYEVDRNKIHIIYPGIDQSTLFRWPNDKVEQIKAKYGIHGKYILFVGNIEPRKNLKGLLLAYEKLNKKIRNEYSMLLIGARGWLDDEIFEIIQRLRIGGNFIQQPNEYVEDKDRAALYSGASLFVYPSLYEGFGIPPLEAMACGVPAITSNNSSLPEAVGDAAIKVDAGSVSELSSAIENALLDEDLRTKLFKKGHVQVKKFSWDKEAAKLLDMFESIDNE